MRVGKSKRLVEQYDQIARFYHGKLPNYSSQIKLLCEGKLNYNDLYDEIQLQSKNKKGDSGNVNRLRLKQILTRDPSRVCYSQIDIRIEDLERECRTGHLLIRGRNILDLAARAARNFRKALAFNRDV